MGRLSQRQRQVQASVIELLMEPYRVLQSIHRDSYNYRGACLLLEHQLCSKMIVIWQSKQISKTHYLRFRFSAGVSGSSCFRFGMFFGAGTTFTRGVGFAFAFGFSGVAEGGTRGSRLLEDSMGGWVL